MNIVGISREFMRRAMSQVDHPQFERRLLEQAGDDGFEVLSIGSELAEMKRKLGGDADHNKEFVQAIVRGANRLAEIFSKLCDDDELRRFLPAEARTPEVRSEFERRDAPILARLCR